MILDGAATNGAATNGAAVSLEKELARYEAERAALIEKEKSLRHDYTFRQRLTPTAKKAAAIVSKIRVHEAEKVWTKVEEEEGDVFPGMCFTLAKERMENSILWKIVKQFPKGALLHAHLEAMVDTDWLLDRALETPGMHMYSEVPLTPENLETAMFDFQYSPTTPSSSASIFSSSYKSPTLISVSVAADSFPTPAGSNTRDAFRAWFKSRTTITPEESMKQHEGINLIWAKFQSVFRIIHGIVYYEPIFRRFVHEVLHNVHADGCLWADLRLAFLMQLRRKDTGEILPRHELVRIFGEVVDAYVAETRGAFWGSRIIWTNVRAFDAKTIMDSMVECIDAKKRYPHIVSGFDLVAQEDKGRTLRSHLPELLQFRRLCAEAGVDIPLYLHAGETLGDGTETDDNLFDAVLLGAKRIGHGFSLYKHPLLMELSRKHGICLEVCPISNEILRLTASIMQHPLPALLAHGVPVSINNDDPGILGQMQTGSMTHDFWQVLQAYDNVGLEGLGDLAETGVRFAAFDGAAVGVEEGIRKKRLEQWRDQWEKFCEWVCEEFEEWA
ncbi:hypothetical protein FN846DRAFT_554281 [Sphaerosporella brunnea]|uniref:adenosine deaminase n=1 Tax=Sphaerosporella brunnea TaxID=1250544 RepID=A0A5J5F2U6_9PEZI|nr:hypothetical protein FN846DRAFT_554281 [Sphaerosporella brunnea]